MNRKSQWSIGRVARVGCGVLIAPFVLIWFMFVAEDISNRISLRNYKPTSLADAVAWKYATPEIVARFIDAGADVNQQVPSPEGKSFSEKGQPIPLISEASWRGNVEVTRLLLHRGARIEDASLWDRARNGNEEMARMLVEEGGSLGRYAQYEEGIGPELLQAAAFGGQAWLVQLILQKGADPQIVNGGRDGLLALALSSEHHDSLETTKALLAAGAHVNPLTDQEVPPIYWAAYRGKLEEMDMLLGKGARVDAHFENGVLRDMAPPPGVRVTALSAAVENCHYEAAETLLRHGASTTSVVTDDGRSLIEGACSHILDSEKPKKDRMRSLLER